MIAATIYSLSPTSYAHISKNYVKQYKCSARWLPTCSVYNVIFSYSGGFAWTSETQHLHVWVKKASRLLEGFRKKCDYSVDAVVFLNTVSAGLSTSVCKMVRSWIYQETLPPEGPHAPWLETSFLLKRQNSGFVCKTTFLFFNLTSCATDCSVPVFVLL